MGLQFPAAGTGGGRIKKWGVLFMRVSHKRFLSGLLAVLLLISAAGSALAYRSQKIPADYGVYVYLDNIVVDYIYPNGQRAKAFVSDGVTYLPVRAVAEALGLSVDWNGDTRTVTLTSGESYERKTELPLSEETILSLIADAEKAKDDSFFLNRLRSLLISEIDAREYSIGLESLYLSEQAVYVTLECPDTLYDRLKGSDVSASDLYDDIVEFVAKVSYIAQTASYAMGRNLKANVQMFESRSGDIVAAGNNGAIIYQGFYLHTYIDADYGVKILLDGREIAYTYPNGQKAEAFVSDGVTYLPVRAIAEALGLGVEWVQDYRWVKLST